MAPRQLHDPQMPIDAEAILVAWPTKAASHSSFSNAPAALALSQYSKFEINGVCFMHWQGSCFFWGVSADMVITPKSGEQNVIGNDSTGIVVEAIPLIPFGEAYRLRGGANIASFPTPWLGIGKTGSAKRDALQSLRKIAGAPWPLFEAPRRL